MGDIDWSGLFIGSAAVVETMVRGTVIYLALFAAIRLIPRRTMGGVGPSDILIIVLASEAVSEGLAGRAESILEALVLAGTVIFWAMVVDILDYHFPHLHISDGKQIPLVRNGRLIQRNLARQMITEDEVMAQLRQHGLSSLQGVESVYLEGDGRVSVLLRGGLPEKPPETFCAR
jgi:uncharacterized membrane protein YcaP (DUF421 family)